MPNNNDVAVAASVRYEVRRRVAILTIDRPERHNAWDFDVERMLFDFADAADADPDVRVIVVTGSGTSFCPGMDISRLASLGAGPGVAERERPPTHLRTIRKPTIAAINGGCAGIGIVQALCCDIRIAAAEARMSCAFPRRGAPAEYGAAWLLPRLIGLADATELLLTGRTFDAAEAERIRLVTTVRPRAELMDYVLDYAADIAAHCAPLAMEAAKTQLAAGATQTLPQAVDLARQLAHEPSRRPDLAEGARAYLDKRPPRFVDLAQREA
ncbi:enoyl-CoA hydratase-related protein [Phytohabitans suffuscus]|uniref:Enoyl-CoA hydratase n=1 Tax=Phytohabitans suffuscus TaxID=624315 RepID=A0A6F8YRL6_9ACTN|nr:enoyl-CoA hydratase-related protein [Phytohabitans suffuscus]BCB88568.1 enoyl-CoA hydratase [Phytohabitans suffuscus]